MSSPLPPRPSYVSIKSRKEIVDGLNNLARQDGRLFNGHLATGVAMVGVLAVSPFVASSAAAAWTIAAVSVTGVAALIYLQHKMKKNSRRRRALFDQMRNQTRQLLARGLYKDLVAAHKPVRAPKRDVAACSATS